MASLDLSKGNGIVASRRRQTFQATSTGAYISGQSSQVRLEINIDKELMDFETGYLAFDLQAGLTNLVGPEVATDWSTLPFTASSWIKDLRVYDRAGREIGEQVRQYNGLARKQFRMLGNDGVNQNYMWRTEGAPQNEDTGIAETQYADGTNPVSDAGTPREYAHKFITHIFDIKSYFPALLLGGVVIEIDMEDANKCLRYTQTGGPLTPASSGQFYVVSNVRYICDLVSLVPDVEVALMNKVNSGGLEVYYDGYMNHSQAFLASQTNQRFDLGIANGRVKSIQSFLLRDSSRENSADYWGRFDRDQITSYRYKLGSEYLTERDVQTNTNRKAEQVCEYLKSMNLSSHDMVHFYGDRQLILGNHTVFGQKVEVSKDPSVSSGRRDFQSNKVELEMITTGSNTGGTMYTNIFLDKVLVILPGRNFRNLS